MSDLLLFTGIFRETKEFLERRKPLLIEREVIFRERKEVGFRERKFFDEEEIVRCNKNHA